MSIEAGQSLKKISIDELRPDMVLASDVITEAGVVLIAKGTMLNSAIFMKLQSNKINKVNIKTSSINYSQNYFVERTDASIPVREREDFKKFEADYYENNQELKQTILDISDGGVINMEKLYSLTDGVMGQLKYKMDIFAYLNFLKDKDEPTFAHSANVSLLTNLFGRWLGYEEDELMCLTTAASLHDIGKTKIPDEILNKPERLSKEEFEIMKKHTVFGYRMLEEQGIPKDVKLAALTHHEKIDGSGYPLGLKHNQITKNARIISICDIYDAMTANRVYRQKLSPFDVIKSFEQHSYGSLDTEFLLIFLRNMAYTYTGSRVVLSDGSNAEVVFINPNNLSLPIIRKVNDEIIDLSQNRDIKIISLIG